MGAHLKGCPPGHADGADAAITYVSAYLLEQALSIDNIFVIALVFNAVPDPREVPAPRAVLGNPRRDRLPRW